MANWNRTIDEDIEAFALTIVNSASTPTTILAGVTIGDKQYRQIASWRIEGHDNAFQWSRNAALTAPVLSVQAYVPWPDGDVGPTALSNVYVRSATAGSTIACSLVVTYGDEEERKQP